MIIYYDTQLGMSAALYFSLYLLEVVGGDYLSAIYSVQGRRDGVDGWGGSGFPSP